MICSTFLEEIESRLADLVNRARSHQVSLSNAQLNWSPGKDLWSIGQIYEHMRLANVKYLPLMEEGVGAARYGRETDQVRHSLVGKMIAKAAGPGTNVPAHPAMIPSAGPFDQKVIESFIREHEALMALAKRALGSDLRHGVRNPYMKLISMNLADCFAIVTAHGERHIGQIEQIMRRPDFPR
ncbi:MAG TPA: DinB family protein [Fimbriimonas sp.]|nr:DinB family protein [Fimbriimonas sp.]